MFFNSYKDCEHKEVLFKIYSNIAWAFKIDSFFMSYFDLNIEIENVDENF